MIQRHRHLHAPHIVEQRGSAFCTIPDGQLADLRLLPTIRVTLTLPMHVELATRRALNIWSPRAPFIQQLCEGLKVHRLHEVCIEAGLSGSLPIVLLAPAGQGD